MAGGEDVYYCVEEHRADLEPTDSGDRYELNRYIAEKSTFKYEADANRLAIKGRSWNGNDPLYMECDSCYPLTGMFKARSEYGVLLMDKDGRFNYAAAYYTSATMKTGTCTKF